MIKLNNVSKRYTKTNQEIVAVNNIDLNIKKGNITGIIGESGAGKSTIIDMITGILKPDSGNIDIDGLIINQLRGNNLREFQKKLGVVFQDYNLLENLTVLKNVMLPLKLNKVEKKERLKRAFTALRYVGLESEINSYPSQLSGGMRQRVAIARAIVNKPEILLLDEITSALDRESADSIIKLLKKINKELNITILLVSHDLLTVKKLCNNVYVIKDGSIVDYLTLPKYEKMDKDFSYREELLGDNHA